VVLAAAAVSAFAGCPASPLGEPVVNGIVTIMPVCHAGYFSQLDTAAKETRIVAYELTAAHSHRKGSRAGLTFKVDHPWAPPGDQGRASDYRASGYELATWRRLRISPRAPPANARHSRW
jgi:hypothetical protein